MCVCAVHSVRRMHRRGDIFPPPQHPELPVTLYVIYVSDQECAPLTTELTFPELASPSTELCLEAREDSEGR